MYSYVFYLKRVRFFFTPQELIFARAENACYIEQYSLLMEWYSSLKRSFSMKKAATPKRK